MNEQQIETTEQQPPAVTSAPEPDTRSPWDSTRLLNWKEKRVLDTLREAAVEIEGEIFYPPMTVREVARLCFPGFRPVQNGDLQVRNAARKLEGMGLIERAPGLLLAVHRAE